ncbi:hydrogenase 4 subunit H [Niveibacterium umoris]|uniref:Formate hydrogenlyase subunit 6/NADH:ubiquinone oxidoreductase subunit I n=1 Tax=Niveibacterium umoris TaxID=1193620 RepID=A0A840BQH4_9RHOO|nr:formate hydrogenlyase complex iron-sulfur subunit [Niveibacterium umoris]MBB4012667.1 formate hydrogenlyase subunit 6/NADH:ubiquinone oxidoreductase subunit I [Niveibacterium umoris]
MFKLLKIIAKAGEATEKYPFAPMPVSPGFRGKPEFTAQQCIACAACAVACPPNALTVKTNTAEGRRTWALNLGRCIFCGRCEEVCPTRAITLSPDFELAVGNKNDLLQQATFTLASCVCCGTPFAPAKEIEYAVALMQASGLPELEVEATRTQFATCPDCKRKAALASIEPAQHLRKGNA